MQNIQILRIFMKMKDLLMQKIEIIIMKMIDPQLQKIQKPSTNMRMIGQSKKEKIHIK